jgi:hypothetical protein
MHWDDAESVARRSRCSARTITSSWELTSVEIKQGFARAECRAGLAKPICEQYKFRRQRRQNTEHLQVCGWLPVIGRIFGWDSEPGAGACETFAMSDGTEARQTELMNLAELI